MKLTRIPSNPAHRQPATISVIYEDRVSGLRAKRFAECLATAVAGDGKASMEMWRCELLEFPELAHQAAIESADAEYILLSLRGDTGLAPFTKHFLENWLNERRAAAPLLIALFDPVRGKNHVTRSICSYLETIAGNSGIHFLSQHTLSPIPEDSPVQPSPVAEPADQKRNSRARSGRASHFSESLAA